METLSYGQAYELATLLREVRDELRRANELTEKQFPKGIQFSAEDEVSTQWRRIDFDEPLFAFTITNTGVVETNADEIQYRLKGSKGNPGNINIGDSVPFSAQTAVFQGIEVRVPPGTTTMGAYRIDGIA